MFGVDGGGAMRVRLGAALVLVLCVLTGCSHSTTSTGTNNQGSSSVPTATEAPGQEARDGATGGPAGVKVPDPCVLITKDDASKVIGETDSSAIAPGGQPGQRSCGYSSSASGKLISVAVWPTDQAAFDKLKAAAGTTKDVPGVGDSAFSAASALYVRKGQLAVSVYVAGVTPDSSQTAALSTLMTTALGRL
jgi:hypothetical protein